MTLRKVLLGTTAVLGAGMLIAADARAADLEVTTGGYARFGVALGDVGDAVGDPDVRDLDFYTDTEIHFDAEATDDQTGITYGAAVELEADTTAGALNVSTDDATGSVIDVSSGSVIDEAWIFVKSGFGELQLGDNDSPSDALKIGAYSIAAGTGGIDGDSPVATVPITIPNSGDATKASYFTPSFGGFTAGVSYTPDEGSSGQNLGADDDGNLEDMFEAGAQYDATFGGFDIQLGATGIIASGEAGRDDVSGYQFGAVTGLFGFSVAGSYFYSEVDGGDETEGFNVGLGASFGPVDASANYGYAEIDGEENEDLVFSASVGFLPGVSINGDVALFQTDEEDVAFDDLDDTGVAGVVRMDVSF